jgi:hypothetical protein
VVYLPGQLEVALLPIRLSPSHLFEMGRDGMTMSGLEGQVGSMASPGIEVDA